MMERKPAKRKIIYLVLVIALSVCFSSACNRVSARQAEEDFKEVNPDVVLRDCFVGEGDSDHAYYHFRYTKRGSEAKWEEMWLYQKQVDGTWKVIRKEGPKPWGAEFSD